MERDTTTLAIQLFTRTGMMMEDASAIAVSIASRAGDDLRADVAQLSRDADRIGCLIRAAQVLLDHKADPSR